jgi:hypothetical protein
MRTNQLLAKLSHPTAYVMQIEKLLAKRRHARSIQGRPDESPSLSTIDMNSRSFSRVLARTVSNGDYIFETMEERTTLIEGKKRSLYRCSLTDKVVLGALAEIAVELIQPSLSPSLHSYQKGKSSLTAINEFARYLEKHKRDHPDPRNRGLYVIKRDIRAYGESIPVADDSPLWPMLDKVLISGAGVPNAHPFLPLIKGAVRPIVITTSGKQGYLDKGVPTGSSIQPAICNLYLTPLDRALDAIPNGFYSRYGDDFLFAHPDFSVAQKAIRLIDEKVSALKLEIKEEKKQNFYFTNPGRPSSDWPACTHTSFVEYLGCRIAFSGIIGLKTEKARRLLHDLHTRMRATRKITDGTQADVLGPTLCAVVNTAIDPHEKLCHPTATLLRYTVNDRAQLKHLDYLIALSLAETISGTRGVRAFRSTPYKKLRREWHLRSLVVARNRIQKKHRRRSE